MLQTDMNNDKHCTQMTKTISKYKSTERNHTNNYKIRTNNTKYIYKTIAMQDTIKQMQKTKSKLKPYSPYRQCENAIGTIRKTI